MTGPIGVHSVMQNLFRHDDRNCGSLRRMSHGKRLLKAWAVAAFSMASIATAAPLDPLGDPALFQRDIEEINRKPPPAGEALARAVGAAVAVDSRMRGRCAPTSITLGPLEPVTLDGMITTMIAKGEIENGWLVSVKLDNCPPADPIRILLLRAPDGESLQGIFAGQGESLAWPSLSREALRVTVNAMLQQLRRADPACAPKDVTPTGVTVSGRSADLGPSQYGIRLKGSWTETWTFEPCGHRITIPIAFRTNGSGGAYWDIDQGGILFVK